MKNSTLTEISRGIPLETRLNVVTQMMFVNLLTKLGYRKDTFWTDEEDELLTKLCVEAKKATALFLKEIKQWEADGRP